MGKKRKAAYVGGLPPRGIEYSLSNIDSRTYVTTPRIVRTGDVWLTDTRGQDRLFERSATLIRIGHRTHWQLKGRCTVPLTYRRDVRRYYLGEST